MIEKNSNKNLIFLIDYVDLKSLDSFLLERCDTIAMTPGAMLAFEQNKLPYLTFDDLYDYRQFRVDNSKLIKATEDLFSILDKKYETFLNFPRAFTGNIYWFLIFFADIYYISRVCEKISRIYDKVYFVGGPAYKALFKVNLEFSSEGLTFGKFEVGLKNKVSMYRACLSPKCIWVNSIPRKCLSLNINKHQLIYLLKATLKEALLKFKSFLPKKMHREKRSIFVIQDGYEVGFLKKYMSKILFINPINRLLRLVREGATSRPDLNPLFSEELNKFINEWFPGLEKYVFELFNLYHSEIICNLDSFSENLKEIFDHYKPVAFFYSIGSNKVYEDLCAYFANKMSIPIFYFQHGGTTKFYKENYSENYIEQNNRIKYISILQSKLEKEVLRKNLSFENQALGSINLYNFYIIQKNKMLQQKRRREVLYGPCPFSFYAYKQLMFNISDRDILEVNKDIINCAGKFQLELDIKVHPSDEEYSYLYFKNLLKSRQSKNIRVLKGFPVEKIVRDYGLLILDYIGTALVPILMALDIPGIIYLKDTSSLRDETMLDIKERFYLVKNKSDLERHIDLYSSGKLKSKFSLEIMDKYAFPINAGNPDVHISDYIQRKISEYDEQYV